MGDLKKEGLRYIEEGFKRIEKYRKNKEIGISFIVQHEVSGGIDMLYTLGIIDLDEFNSLHKRAIDLSCAVEHENYSEEE